MASQIPFGDPVEDFTPGAFGPSGIPFGEAVEPESSGVPQGEDQSFLQNLAGVARSKAAEGLDVAGDMLVSGAIGANQMVGIFGDMEALRSGTAENWATRQRDLALKYYGGKKSDALLRMEAERSEEIAQAEAEHGPIGALGAALYGTYSRPRLLAAFLAEQSPMLLPVLGSARLGAVGAKMLGAAPAMQATVGQATAVMTGAMMQGADGGRQTMDQLAALPDAMWTANGDVKKLMADGMEFAEAKNQVLMDLSRDAFKMSAAVSLAANLIPGSRILEKSFTGIKLPGSRFKNILASVLGETFQEGVEEGSAAFISNLETSEIDIGQDLFEGVGEQTGMGMAAGAFGVLSGFGKKDDDVPEPGEKFVNVLDILEAKSPDEALAVAQKAISGKLSVPPRGAPRIEPTISGPDPIDPATPAAGLVRNILSGAQNAEFIDRVVESSAPDATGEPRSYASTQFALPSDQAERLKTSAAMEIDPADIEPTKGLEPRPHITLLYGLEGEQPSAELAELVRPLVSGAGKVTGTVGPLEIFKTKDADVLVHRVDSKQLGELREKIRSTLPNTQEFDEYKPHITVGYLKKGTGEKYLGIKTGLEGQPVEFDALEVSDTQDQITKLPLITEGVNSPQVGVNTPAAITGEGADNVLFPKDQADAALEKLKALAPKAPGAIETKPVRRPKSKTEKSADIPVEPHDPRLKRESFRNRIQSMASDLVKGGGVTYTYDDRGQINGRTSSGNPAWFQSMITSSDHQMSVKQVQKTVEKALAGKRLGVREARVVSLMLNEHKDERTDPDELRYQRNLLEEARARRRAARPDTSPIEDVEPDYGEQYEEQEYPPEMTAEARLLLEAMQEAADAGVPDETIAELAGTEGDPISLMLKLEALTNARGRQTGAGAVPEVEEGRTQTGEAGAQTEETDEVTPPVELSLDEVKTPAPAPAPAAAVQPYTIEDAKRDGAAAQRAGLDAAPILNKPVYDRMMAHAATLPKSEKELAYRALLQAYTSAWIATNANAAVPGVTEQKYPRVFIKHDGASEFSFQLYHDATDGWSYRLSLTTRANAKHHRKAGVVSINEKGHESAFYAVMDAAVKYEGQSSKLAYTADPDVPGTFELLEGLPDLNITADQVTNWIARKTNELHDILATPVEQRTPEQMMLAEGFTPFSNENPKRTTDTYKATKELGLFYYKVRILQENQPMPLALQNIDGVTSTAALAALAPPPITDPAKAMFGATHLMELEFGPDNKMGVYIEPWFGFLGAGTIWAAALNTQPFPAVHGLVMMGVPEPASSWLHTANVADEVRLRTRPNGSENFLLDSVFEQMAKVTKGQPMVSPDTIYTKAVAPLALFEFEDAFTKTVLASPTVAPPPAPAPTKPKRPKSKTEQAAENPPPPVPRPPSVSEMEMPATIEARITALDEIAQQASFDPEYEKQLGKAISDLWDMRATIRQKLKGSRPKAPTNTEITAEQNRIWPIATNLKTARYGERVEAVMLMNGVEVGVGVAPLRANSLEVTIHPLSLAPIPFGTEFTYEIPLNVYKLANKNTDVGMTVGALIERDYQELWEFEKDDGGLQVPDPASIMRFVPDAKSTEHFFVPADPDQLPAPPVAPPAAPPAQTQQARTYDPASYPAKTGEQFRATVFRGYGRADLASVYGGGVPVPLLGRDVSYYGFSPESVSQYGPTLETREIQLENPLVISSDADFRDWFKQAGSPGGAVNPSPFGGTLDERTKAVKYWGDRMLAYARGRGHDGLVVQWDDKSMYDFDPRNPEGYKLLRNVWDHSTVVVFEPPRFNDVAPVTRTSLLSDGSSNKLFTKDAADAALQKLKDMLPRQNVGLDPEALSLVFQRVGFHVERGLRSLPDVIAAMVAEIGAWIAPYVPGAYTSVRMDPNAGDLADQMDSLAEIEQITKDIRAGKPITPRPAPVDYTAPQAQENQNDAGTAGSLAPNSGQPGAGIGLGQETVSPAGRPDGGNTGGASNPAGAAGLGRPTGGRVSTGRPAVGGKGRDSGVLEPAGDFVAPVSTPGSEQRVGSSTTRSQGLSPDDQRDGAAASRPPETAGNTGTPLERQRAADARPYVAGDLESIRNTLPNLLPGQHDDVLKAETWWGKQELPGILVTNGTGTGKAQPLTAKVMTPAGWSLMGDLKVGDRVLGSAGLPVEVLGVYPQGEKDIYRVTFSDGATTECCAEHLWLTQTTTERRYESKHRTSGLGTPLWACARPKVRQLSEIIDTLDEQHYVPMSGALHFTEKLLPIPPYALGVILGDGCLSSEGVVTLTNPDPAVTDRVASLMSDAIELRPIKRSAERCPSFAVRSSGAPARNAWLDALCDMGLMGSLSVAKFVPPDYLRGSIEQRTDLLQGLMDTDGTVDKKTGVAYFCSSSAALVGDVCFLARSLGGTAKVANRPSPSYTHNGERRTGQPAYRVYLNMPANVILFSHPGKAGLYRANEKYFPRRHITDITLVGVKPAQCIAVDAPDHLYVTDDGIVTHNTFTGLGMIKRQFQAGNIQSALIVVTTQQMATVFQREAATYFGITAEILESTQVSGRAPLVITTYANFADNPSLLDRQFGLVMYDESHHIQHNEAGDRNSRLHAHQALTLHPETLYSTAKGRMRADFEALDAKYSEVVAWQATKKYGGQPPRTVEYRGEMNKLVERARAEAERIYLEETRPKVVYLSASPFGYVKNIQYIDQSVIAFNGQPNKKSTTDSGRYNSGDDFERYLMANFGYRMRTNKLTEPEGGVDRGLMERSWNETVRSSGGIIRRVLEVPFDYSRKFYEYTNQLGEQIDEGMRWIKGWKVDEEGRHQRIENGLDPAVVRYFESKWDYLYLMTLIEGLNAREAVRRAQKHLDMGRKVVAFHRFKTRVPSHPFRFENTTDDSALTQASEENSISVQQLREKIAELETLRPDLYNLPLTGLANPIDAFMAAFGDQLGIINGDVTKKSERVRRVDDFQNDNGTYKVMLVQIAAGREGISLHDKTGGSQRALIQIGLPVEPIDLIQTEGRIYREGLKSNAVYELLRTGLGYEDTAFAQSVAKRSGTAENLAMGNDARDLMASIIDAYTNAEYLTDPSPDQGTGGKARDRMIAEVSRWDQAKTRYWAQPKKTSRNKSEEGTDYFPTPEPLGLKMVEWADLKPGEKAMEPSAGHGAIARWLPIDTRNTLIENSPKLAPGLQLRVPHGNVREEDFLQLPNVNKAHAIVMNPPFGVAGADAMKHLRKAAKFHLYPGGRIVALIPRGAMDKKFDEWMYGDKNDAEGLYVRATINLPTVVFERAGTKVSSRIVVIDYLPEKQFPNPITDQYQRDITNIDNINELFDQIEHMQMPVRNVPVEPVGLELEDTDEQGNPVPVAAPAPSARSPGPAPTPTSSDLLGTYDQKNSQTGEAMFMVVMNTHLGDRFAALNALAKASGGYYSRYQNKPAGIKSGFAFKTADARTRFLSTAINAAGEPQFALTIAPIGFYSGLERAAQGLKQQRGTAEQMLQAIRKTPGVKQEEIDFTALEEFLAAKVGQVTKEEIVTYLQGHGVQVEVSVAGTSDNKPVGGLGFVWDDVIAPDVYAAWSLGGVQYEYNSLYSYEDQYEGENGLDPKRQFFDFLYRNSWFPDQANPEQDHAIADKLGALYEKGFVATGEYRYLMDRFGETAPFPQNGDRFNGVRVDTIEWVPDEWYSTEHGHRNGKVVLAARYVLQGDLSGKLGMEDVGPAEWYLDMADQAEAEARTAEESIDPDDFYDTLVARTQATLLSAIAPVADRAKEMKAAAFTMALANKAEAGAYVPSPSSEMIERFPHYTNPDMILKVPNDPALATVPLNYREVLFRVPREFQHADTIGRFENDPHWSGVSNVLAHARISDRMVDVGTLGMQKTLHIEEMQSDWHQAARDDGMLTPTQQRAREAPLESSINRPNSEQTAQTEVLVRGAVQRAVNAIAPNAHIRTIQVLRHVAYKQLRPRAWTAALNADGKTPPVTLDTVVHLLERFRGPATNEAVLWTLNPPASPRERRDLNEGDEAVLVLYKAWTEDLVQGYDSRATNGHQVKRLSTDMINTLDAFADPANAPEVQKMLDEINRASALEVGADADRIRRHRAARQELESQFAVARKAYDAGEAMIYGATAPNSFKSARLTEQEHARYDQLASAAVDEFENVLRGVVMETFNGFFPPNALREYAGSTVNDLLRTLRTTKQFAATFAGGAQQYQAAPGEYLAGVIRAQEFAGESDLVETPMIPELDTLSKHPAVVALVDEFLRQQEVNLSLGDHINKTWDRPYDAQPELKRAGVFYGSAPFARNGWIELSFKKLLQMAVEGGYDAVSWSPGAIHAARWGKGKKAVVERNEFTLSKSSDGRYMLEWSAIKVATGAGHRTFNAVFFDPVGSIHEAGSTGTLRTGSGNENLFNFLRDDTNRHVEVRSLASVFGESAAGQIMAKIDALLGPRDVQVFRVEGQPVSYGNSPFETVYDNVTRNLANNVVRRLDKSARIEWAPVHTDAMDLQDEPIVVSSPTLRITDQIRERVTGEGLSLFDKTNTSAMGSPTSGPKGGLQNPVELARIEALVAAVQEKLGTRARIDLIRAASIPDEVASKQPQGRWGRAWLIGDTVTLVADRFQTMREVEITLAHELVGHLGVNNVVDNWSDLQTQYQAIKKRGGKTFKRLHGDLMSRYGQMNADTELKEFIALMAEKRVEESSLARWWRQVQEAVRRGLRALGFSRMQGLTDLDILLSRSQAYLGGGSVMDYRRGSAARMPQFAIRAWHGSPHKFDKFDLSKMGTGEGAQAYGAGHYLAGRKEVAEYYRDALAKTRFKSLSEPEANSILPQMDALHDEANANGIEAAQKLLDSHIRQLADIAKYEPSKQNIEALSALRKLKKNGEFAPELSKHLYEVEIPDDGYLLWDRPLDESVGLQEKLPKEAIEAIDREYPGADAYPIGKESGEGLYRVLGQLLVNGHLESNLPDSMLEEDSGFSAASAYLKSLGIPGIKYLDGSSRSKGEGAYNYVIFDDADIEITQRQPQFAADRPQDESIDVGGIARPVHNSKGQRIHPTDFGIQQFWDWFAGSVVVDEKGRPLVVYHGTETAGFGEFNADKQKFSSGSGATGFHFFTNSILGAQTYSGTKKDAVIYQDPEFDARFDGEPGNYAVYLRMKNPVIVDFEGADWTAAPDGSGFGGENINNIAAHASGIEEYDGVIAENISDEGPHGQGYGWGDRTYVVFEPEQIKAVDGNNGDFSSRNPHIQFALHDEYTPPQVGAIQRYGMGLQIPARATRALDWMHRYRGRYWDYFRQKAIDPYNSLRKVLRDDPAWWMANLSHGTSSAVEAGITRGRLFFSDNVLQVDETQASLTELLQPLGHDMNRFAYWIIGNRSDRLLAEGREHLGDRNSIDILMAMDQDGQPGDPGYRPGRAALFAQVRAEFEAWHNAVTQIAVDTGLVNQEEADIWFQQGFYLPFYRVLDDEQLARGPRAMGDTGLVMKTAFQRLRGGTEQLNDPWSNMLMNVNHLLSASTKNNAGTHALQAAVALNGRNGLPLATRIPAPHGAAPTGAVWVRANGRPVWYLLNVQDAESALVLDSLTALNWNGMNGPSMALQQGFKRLLTFGVTLSPEFKVANFVRDTLSALAVSSVDPRFWINIRDGWRATAANSPDMGTMLATAAIFPESGFMGGGDADAIRRVVRRRTPGRAPGQTVTADRIDRMLASVEAGYRAYQDFGARLENVNRAANFVQSQNRGDTLLQSAFEARDHVDFSRIGSSVAIRYLAKTVPFMNARIQGLDKLGRAAADPHTRARFYTVAGLLSAASVLLYLAMKDDDDYKNLDQHERDTYYHFKIPGIDQLFKFPRPFELGAIGAMMERVTEQFVDRSVKPDLLRQRLMHTLLDTFAMNPTPAWARPGLEIAMDQNWFTRGRIEGEYLETVLGPDAYRSTTSDTTRVLSKDIYERSEGQVDLSPVQIEHAVRGYMGWMGNMILAGTDSVVETLTNAPSEPAKQWSERLLLKRFAKKVPAYSTRQLTEFYEQLDEIRSTAASFDKATKLGNEQRAAELNAEYLQVLMLEKSFNNVASTLTAASKQIDLTVYDPALTPEEKAARIDQLLIMRNELAGQALEVSAGQSAAVE